MVIYPLTKLRYFFGFLVKSQEHSIAYFVFRIKYAIRVFRAHNIRDSDAFTISINYCRADD